MSKEYFPHDYGARLSLRGIRKDFGLQGLGFYWCFVEILHEEGGYWSIIAIVTALMIVVQPTFAASETIWDRFSAIMRDFYGQIVTISTIVAVTMAAVALIVRLASRNQKAVDEATSWLKRIVITWIILNSLGFIVAYIQPLIAGGNYGG